MSEKKRKRELKHDSASKARIVPVQGSNMVKVVHVPRERSGGPVIATSAGITVPPNLQWTLYEKNLNQTTTERLLHTSKLEKIDYTARESSTVSTDSVLKHYIGIYDPKTNEMQLMEAQHMHVRNSVREEELEIENDRIATLSKERSLRQQLGMEFGTKKAKKMIASITENAISPRKAEGLSVEQANKLLKNDATATAVLDSMSSSMQNAPSKAMVEAVVEASKPRPKANLNALTPDEAYSSDEIIGTEVLNQIKVKPWFDAITSEQHISTESRFVTNRVVRLINENRVNAVKILKFMLLVLKFYKAGAPLKKGGRKLPQPRELKNQMQIDELLLDAMKAKFSNGEGTITKWHSDLIVTTLAVLSLIVDNFETDTFDLREDLGLKAVQLLKYYMEIGATIRSMSDSMRIGSGLQKSDLPNHKVAKLRVPLQFPTEKRPMAPRRR